MLQEGSENGVVAVTGKQQRKLNYRQSKPKKRGVVIEEGYYDGPVTRSMRNQTNSDKVLVDGIKDDIKEFQRTVYNKRVCLILTPG